MTAVSGVLNTSQIALLEMEPIWDSSLPYLSLAICEIRKLFLIVPKVSSKSKILQFSTYCLYFTINVFLKHLKL